MPTTFTVEERKELKNAKKDYNYRKKHNPRDFENRLSQFRASIIDKIDKISKGKHPTISRIKMNLRFNTL